MTGGDSVLGGDMTVTFDDCRSSAVPTRKLSFDISYCRDHTVGICLQGIHKVGFITL